MSKVFCFLLGAVAASVFWLIVFDVINIAAINAILGAR